MRERMSDRSDAGDGERTQVAEAATGITWAKGGGGGIYTRQVWSLLPYKAEDDVDLQLTSAEQTHVYPTHNSDN